MTDQMVLLLSIIVILVIIGTSMGYKSMQEPFSPLGFASNCPEYKIPDSSHLGVEGCGPGCWILKNKNTENFGVDRNCTTDRIPQIPHELPVGHLSTMGSPLTGQASCTSGVNGVQKLLSSNPFGKLSNDNQFTQSYAACTFGSNNIFDKDQLIY